MTQSHFSSSLPKLWDLGAGRPGWVSVIVPTYNRVDLILETLESVNDQSYRPIDLVVIDDGSTDNTEIVVKEWIERTERWDRFIIRLIKQENAGASAARNRGLKESVGEFIQFLDSDDKLERNKIKIQVDAITSESTDFAYGRVYDLETESRLIYCQTEMGPERMIFKQITNPTFTTLGPLFTRGMIEMLGPWNVSLRCCDDWEYHSRAAVLGFRGVYTPAARALVRMVVDERLSWRGEPERIEEWLSGRWHQLGSMITCAPVTLREKPEFRSAIAWEMLTVTARAVRLGWRGDDTKCYIEAAKFARRGSAVLVERLAQVIRRMFSQPAAAIFILMFPWARYRWQAIKFRFVKA